MSLRTADCHNDLLQAVRHQRERGHRDPFGDFWLPQLKAGGVAVQVLPVCTHEEFVGEGALRRCLLLLEEARHLADLHRDHVVIVETRRDLEAALRSGRIALLLAIEGAEPIGNDVELIDALWRNGVRMCSLSWNRRTMLADGVGERDTGGVLTGLGVRAVQRMEERGILVDVSHLSEAGFFHLAEVTTRPFVASHSACRAVTDHPRNLTDAQLRVMADRDCLLAVNSFGPFLAPGQATIDSYLDHVEHAASILGWRRVGLGLDFIKDTSEVVDPVYTGALIGADEIRHTDGLVRPADLAGLAAAAGERFGSAIADDIMFGNLTRALAGGLPA